MEKPACRIGRVYPRLIMGGAEAGILQLLETIGDTHMVVTMVEGARAERAREIAKAYTLCERPRFLSLFQALQGCEVVHIHTINNHLLIPLAAQLAGPAALVQTVHNRLEAEYCHFVDHTIVLGPATLPLLDTPTMTTVVPNAIPVLEPLPEYEPWHRAGRPLRIVEIRREDKPMTHTLEALLATGILDDLDLEAKVIGFHRDAPDPRITYLGPQDDPYPTISWADVLVHGSATESFGRTVYEAMGCGAIPIATQLPTFTGVFPPGDGAVRYLAEGDVRDAAASLKRHLEELLGDADGHLRIRAANHQRVLKDFSLQTMADRTEAVYQATVNGNVPRSFRPDDLETEAVPLFGELVDDLMEARPPQRLAEASRLPERSQGVFAWLLSRHMTSKPDQRLGLVLDAMRRLGDRHILLLDLGRVLQQTGRNDKALAAYKRASELRPKSLAAWVAGAELLVKSGDLRKALAWVDRALASVPGYQPLRDLRKNLKRAR